MNRRVFLKLAGLAALQSTLYARGAAAAEGRRPNVLLITIDDMNDGISLFGADRPFKTPNIEALAKRGVFFSRAYCASAACNPSRAAMLTGLRPHKTGIYGNKTDWRGACRGHLTIPEYFRKHGYYAAGFGKVYHHHSNGAFNDPGAWDTFKKMDPQYMPPKKLNGATGYGSRNTDWGAWPEDGQESRTIDFKSVGYAIKVLQQRRDPSRSTSSGQARKPFFLACGIFKNHAVRSKRWRYIRYADGTEELYDHSKDPNEWTNLADDRQYAPVIKDHRKWIPQQNAPAKPDLKTKKKKP